MSELVIRLAAPAELDTLRAIDDESGPMYLAAGVNLGTLSLSHPFVQAEQESWLRALHDARAHAALVDGHMVGFCVLAQLDGQPYLEQLSVRAAFMRRGFGSALLRHALSITRSAGPLWLTTYAHLPWNAPFYERAGFRRVPDSGCGSELREVLHEQRRVMPAPELRVAMVHD